MVYNLFLKGDREMNRDASGETFSGLRLESGEISAAVFEDCLFENCRFSELALENCRFTGCHFLGCTVTGMKFRNVQAMGNSFENCSLSGVDWSALLDERKRDMGFLPFDAFSACTLRRCVFYGLDLRKFDFHGCDLSGSYFDDCNLTKSDFSDSVLRGTSFSHNDMSGADFRHASEYLFSLESNKVAKAKFSLPEAVNLLSALGIVLDEE